MHNVHERQSSKTWIALFLLTILDIKTYIRSYWPLLTVPTLLLTTPFSLSSRLTRLFPRKALTDIRYSIFDIFNVETIFFYFCTSIFGSFFIRERESFDCFLKSRAFGAIGRFFWSVCLYTVFHISSVRVGLSDSFTLNRILHAT